jgi:hypothetical protein
MRAGAIAIAATLILAGCGGSSGEGTTSSTTGAVAEHGPGAGAGAITGKLPPGAVAPPDADEENEGPAATEASPGEAPEGPEASGELPAADRSAIATTVAAYIRALDRREAGRVCSLVVSCRGSLPGTIGARPGNGGPAWRRSKLTALKLERLGDDRARVSATAVHHFSDRKYVSVEDDVIYLERVGGRWLLAKPSATFYRAIGYSEPPLRAFAPPPGW